MRIVDLRSDTLTKPTPAMRRAMAEAEVGDDVFGEDPTINRLEEMAAERLGKEAGLFVASGTMGNLVSLLAHCNRGDEIILGDNSHTFYSEQGGSAAIAGIHPRTLTNQPDGKLALKDIEASIRPDDIHHPRSHLIVLENTHNRRNGSPLDAAYMRSVKDLADKYKLKIHVDGARLFNAAVALGVDARELVADADSVSFCLSKGLAAPVGSVICGTDDFIVKARRARKLLGGGMRQAGVLAAAGIVALTEMTDRLAEDHANARKLAEGLAEMPGLSIDPAMIKTNIVYFETTREDLLEDELVRRLDREGVKISAMGPRLLRAVTYYQITGEDIEFALHAFSKILK
ncbi:MAG: low-specificity L-threonine aldolase [Phycisphaerae bacterium]|nr:low-specificity L-threonine aldolase [Phycisphaerae bacterium]NIW94572.1 low-specificity L-threonine aldolase [Phycisphaerae bacterium]